jgi:hypothetical protein
MMKDNTSMGDYNALGTNKSEMGNGPMIPGGDTIPPGMPANDQTGSEGGKPMMPRDK